jgi:hypothetical protein
LLLLVKPLQPGLPELRHIAFIKGAAGDQEKFADEGRILRGHDVTQPGAPRKTDQHNGLRSLRLQSHPQFVNLAFQSDRRLERLQNATTARQFARDRSHFTSRARAAVDNSDGVWRCPVTSMVCFHYLNFRPYWWSKNSRLVERTLLGNDSPRTGAPGDNHRAAVVFFNGSQL